MNRKLLILGIVAATITACDPYTAPNDAPAKVILVTATSGPAGEAYAGEEASPGVWDVSGIASTCVDGSDITANSPILFVTLSNLLNPTSVQTSLEDCTPKGATRAPVSAGNLQPVTTPGWLTVTGPALPAGYEWYTCYSPSSPSAAESGAIVIFAAKTPIEQVACTVDVNDEPVPDVSVPSGSSGAKTFPTDVNGPVTYTFTGSVVDNGGNTVPIDVTTTYDPDVGAVRNFFATSTTPESSAGANDGTVTFTWAPPACATSSTAWGISVKKLNATTGDYEQIATLPITDATYTASGLGQADPASFHLDVVNGTTYEFTLGSASNVIPGFGPLAAPALALGTETPGPGVAHPIGTVTVTWTMPTAAPVPTGYNIQRALDDPNNPGTPLTWSTIRSNGAPAASPATTTSYTDTSAPAGAHLHYRMVPRLVVGSATAIGVTGAIAEVDTTPAQPTYPSFKNVAETSIDVVVAVQSPQTSTILYDLYQYQDDNDPATPIPTQGPPPGAGWTLIHTFTQPTQPDPPLAPITSQTFTATGLAANRTYYYYVVARNPPAAGQVSSLPGLMSSATTMALATPGAPTATAASATSVDVSWTAVTGATTGYLVQRAKEVCGAPGTWLDIQTVGPVTTFTDTTVAAGTTYYYRIVALGAGQSAPSAASAPVTP
jgi:fibronectin type 3 domain-containing protein